MDVEAPPPSDLEGGCREIDSDDVVLSRDLGAKSAGATTEVQKTASWADKPPQAGENDRSASREPPVRTFDLVKLRTVLFDRARP